MKFQMCLPAPLRPENGTVKCGDDTAGWMFTRGHKFSESKPQQDSEDYVTCVSKGSCTVGGVFDGHGGTVCPRACAEMMVPQFAKIHDKLTSSISSTLRLVNVSLVAELACMSGAF